MKPSNQTVKSILLLFGSFTFAFLFGEMVHEYGHYLSHQFYGYEDVKIHLDPFGGSRIVGTPDLPVEMMGFTSAAGPLFDLAMGLLCFSLVWRKRKPILLPFLLWGPVAMIQEGVNFSLGLLTPGGDASWIVAWGIPQALLLISGGFLLLAGVGVLTLLLPLAGIQRGDPFKRKLLIVLAGMCALMLIRSAHSFLVSPESIMENLYPLVLSLILAFIAAALHKPITSLSTKISSQETPLISWSAASFAIALGFGLFFFQIAALN
jgi:hypothetical protein